MSVVCIQFPDVAYVGLHIRSYSYFALFYSLCCLFVHSRLYYQLIIVLTFPALQHVRRAALREFEASHAEVLCEVAGENGSSFISNSCKSPTYLFM